jgi:3-hydroxypropanoate dehydrogenase
LIRPTLEDAALDQLFREARSVKRFRSDPVPHETLTALYELAKWGPTTANCTPARFVFVTSDAGRETLTALAAEGNRAKVASAPCTVIIGQDMDFPELMPRLAPHIPGAREHMAKTVETEALRSSSLQGAYLILAARALGLDCCPMGGFDHDGVDAAFFSGRNVKSNFICGLGVGTDEGLHPRGDRLSLNEACGFA